MASFRLAEQDKEPSYAFFLLALLIAAAPVQAHDGYSNWINKADRGCCNNNDCDRISDENVRYTPRHVEVRIGNEWCEVMPHHYLKTGNAPDWSSAHVCIQKNNYLHNAPQSLRGTACHTLLCFQPKPQF